jgi:hypothetical protein
MKTATNKWLLISESRSDSNRCTLFRGKPDQHATRFLRSVHVCQPFMSHWQIWMDSTALDKKGSRHNLQHAGWPIRRFVSNFSPMPTNEVVDISQASVKDKLLGLLDSYHQHAIGTFNTCSWGPTHRSLIDTSGGYSPGGASLPHTTLQPSQLTVSTFHLRASFGLRLSIQQLLNDLERDQTLSLMSGSLHSTSTVIYHLSIAWANDIPPKNRVNKGNPEGSSKCN